MKPRLSMCPSKPFAFILILSGFIIFLLLCNIDYLELSFLMVSHHHPASNSQPSRHQQGPLAAGDGKKSFGSTKKYFFNPLKAHERTIQINSTETAFTEPYVKPTVTNSNATNDEHCDFCPPKPPSPEEALVERQILDAIVWPKTPLWQDPFSLEGTSDPAHSTFAILPGRAGGEWRVGDQLEVMIQMYDFRGSPKKSGGDVLLAQMHNRELDAGVAGQVVDHLNGSYTAVFSLLWEGEAQVEVTLVHPSEAVTVLRRLTREQPDRISFQSLFQSGHLSETTMCNVCIRPTQELLCNFTDLHTGEPWFCVKPKVLSCDTRINHAKRDFKQDLKTGEEKLFESNVNLKVIIQASGPNIVVVRPQKRGEPEVKSRNGQHKPSGYYFQGLWRAIGGTAVQQFNTSSAITQCLKGKNVYLYGDSTIRQWFEHLSSTVEDLKEVDLHSGKQVGPFKALDNANKITVTYRCHGPPIRFANVPVTELRYIANELDSLIGGPDTVVVIGIWSHFSTFPVEVYIRRLQSIRAAVDRLLRNYPGTLVIIRTANLKALTLYETLTNSDWYSLQRDKVLRHMFKRMNVKMVDAWEMTLAHILPHSLHPQPPIIKNMIDVVLSYVCPQAGV